MAKVNRNKIEPHMIVVTGLGMISSIGRDVLTSCASARAGITRESKLDYFGVFEEDSAKVVPVVGHTMTGFAEGFAGLGKLIRLGNAAVADLLGYIDSPRTDFSKTGFFLNLSSGYYLNLSEIREREQLDEPELEEDDENYEPFEMQIRQYTYSTSLIPRLVQLSGISCESKYQKVYFKDHMGVIAALNDAIPLLQKGILDRCIIGGIDSFVEQDTLEVLSECKILKTTENAAGFIPGEAAAFIMLQTYEKAMQGNAKIEGIVELPSIKREEEHRFSEKVSAGMALSESILGTLDGLTDRRAKVALIIGNLNGDPWRASEWGNALARVSAKYEIANWGSWFPALSFGETGAATGSIAVCFGIRGFVRNYIKGDILIALSNEDGNKGAVYLKRW